MLGSIVWLWMNSENHRNLPLHTLSTALLPAIKARQFVLASEQGKAVFFASWAMLNSSTEQHYLDHHQLLMPQEHWQSGDRMWCIDWVAPFGHSKAMGYFLTHQLMANCCARSLYHRGREHGKRVQTFFGKLVSAQERRLWKAEHTIKHTDKNHSKNTMTDRDTHHE